MTKAFQNPYAHDVADLAHAREKKTPARPIYDYDSEISDKYTRKKNPQRVAYNYPDDAQELVPAPPTPLVVPKPADLSGMLIQKKNHGAKQSCQGNNLSHVQESGEVRPNAAVTPAARARRTAYNRQSIGNAVPMEPRELSQQTQAKQQGRQPPAQQKRKMQARLARHPSDRRSTRQMQAPKPPHQISYEDVRRQRVRHSMAMALGVVAAVAIGLILSVTVLFKIETINVEFTETSVYTPEQVTAALGIVKGDNLFGFQTKKTQEAVLRALPYLDTVSLCRRLPNSVKVVVTPARESFAVYSDYGWAVLSETMKVLRVETEAPPGITQVKGILAQAPIVGQPVNFDSSAETATSTAETSKAADPFEKTQAEDTAQSKTLYMLYTAIVQKGLVPVTEIDLTSRLELSFIYDSRVRVIVGTVNELDAKLDWARYLLEEQKVITAEEKGTLDVSTRNAEGRLSGVVRAGKL